jgi:hypothetical protein
MDEISKAPAEVHANVRADAAAWKNRCIFMWCLA